MGGAGGGRGGGPVTPDLRRHVWKQAGSVDPKIMRKARWISLPVGLGAGLFGSLVGVGGGVLVVPTIVAACGSIPQRCARLFQAVAARKQRCWCHKRNSTDSSLLKTSMNLPYSRLPNACLSSNALVTAQNSRIVNSNYGILSQPGSIHRAVFLRPCLEGASDGCSGLQSSNSPPISLCFSPSCFSYTAHSHSLCKR